MPFDFDMTIWHYHMSSTFAALYRPACDLLSIHYSSLMHLRHI